MCVCPTLPKHHVYFSLYASSLHLLHPLTHVSFLQPLHPNSDWDRYAIAEYYRLAEVDEEMMDDDDMDLNIGLDDGDRSDSPLSNGDMDLNEEDQGLGLDLGFGSMSPSPEPLSPPPASDSFAPINPDM